MYPESIYVTTQQINQTGHMKGKGKKGDGNWEVRALGTDDLCLYSFGAGRSSETLAVFASFGPHASLPIQLRSLLSGLHHSTHPTPLQALLQALLSSIVLLMRCTV